MIKVTVQQVVRRLWSHGCIYHPLHWNISETRLFYLQSYLEKRVKYYNQCLVSHRSYKKTPKFILIVLFSQNITGRYKLTVCIETFFSESWPTDICSFMRMFFFICISLSEPHLKVSCCFARANEVSKAYYRAYKRIY